MKKKIAIAAGGDSGEYEVSIKSAAVVEEHLDRELYDTYVIVMRNNEWKHTDDGGEVHFINREDFSLSIRGEKIIFDAVYIAIHGTPGEDGKLPAYLDMLNIPYTACNQTTSAITFNKYFCNLLVSGLGVRVAPSIVLHKGMELDYEAILDVSGLPCFVKPNSGGSSVGMSKVNNAGDLPSAIEKAFIEDEQVLVEGFISGREITCGVIADGDKVRSLPLTEIVSKKEFFDYEAKYTDGLASEITPAQVPKQVEQQCRDTSEMLYKRLNCQGVVRVDYIFNESGLFFLEVNTIPGLSANSIIPQQAAYAGISLPELFSIVLKQALAN
ncbi:MAG: D-alanine--D-alanine ligase [Bacteroidota bacterium]